MNQFNQFTTFISMDPFHNTVMMRLMVISIVNPPKVFIFVFFIFLCKYISNAVSMGGMAHLTWFSLPTADVNLSQFISFY